VAPTRAVIIYNPTSGFVRHKSGYVATMIGLLRANGVEAEACPTSSPSEGADIARRAVTRGTDIVISHGGDGTVNEVIQGMVGGAATLAVWSGGTANIVARELGLPWRKEELAPIIGARRSVRISLGRATLASPSDRGDSITRYFIMVAGVGLDASVCREVSPSLKRLSGKFAFGVSAARHLLVWRQPPFKLTVGDRTVEAAFAVIANGARYGAPVVLTPGARLEEGSFEVFALPVQERNLAYLGELLRCRRGGPETTNGTAMRGGTVEAVSDHEVWVQLDGEVAGRLPARFEIVPEALSVIVP
jgi:diacylglycerol kinase family enzyme